jgi:hypothetical protein
MEVDDFNLERGPIEYLDLHPLGAKFTQLLPYRSGETSDGSKLDHSGNRFQSNKMSSKCAQTHENRSKV